MSAPLIGSITSHIWFKVKDKQTLNTMEEGHKEHWCFYPKKSSWETLQRAPRQWILGICLQCLQVDERLIRAEPTLYLQWQSTSRLGS